MPILHWTQKDDPVGQPERAHQLRQARLVTFLVISRDDERCVRHPLPGLDQTIEALFPTDPAQKEDITGGQRRERSIAERRGIRRPLDTVGNEVDIRSGKAERNQFRSFEGRGGVHGGRPSQRRTLEQGDPQLLDPTALALDQIADEHATRCENIRNTGAESGPGASQHRAKKHAVNVDDVECRYGLPQTPAQSGRPPEPPHRRHRKVMHSDAVTVYGLIKRNIDVSVSVDVGGVDLHVVATPGKRRGKAMD